MEEDSVRQASVHVLDLEIHPSLLRIRWRCLDKNFQLAEWMRHFGKYCWIVLGPELDSSVRLPIRMQYKIRQPHILVQSASDYDASGNRPWAIRAQILWALRQEVLRFDLLSRNRKGDASAHKPSGVCGPRKACMLCLVLSVSAQILLDLWDPQVPRGLARSRSSGFPPQFSTRIEFTGENLPS